MALNMMTGRIPIHKSSLPAGSVLISAGQAWDYVDSFLGVINDKSSAGLSSADIGKLFFTSGPKWIELLFLLRNKITRRFGLKTGEQHADRQLAIDRFRCEPGERLGLFSVYSRTANEVVLGEEDKHLDFKVSLFIERPGADNEKGSLTISTVVRFNHWSGRLYFLPVKQFHRLVVPAILRSMIRAIDTRDDLQQMK